MSNGKLLVHPKPYPDESVPGYILRLMELNGYRYAHGFFNGAGLSFNNASQMHNAQVDIAVQGKIADFANRTVEEINQQGYRLEASITRPTSIHWRGFALPIDSLRTTQACVCPQCLVDTPYVRQAWDWAFVTACPTHQCILYDSCPACSRPLLKHRETVCLCLCRFDFRKIVPEPATAKGASAFLSSEAGDEISQSRRFRDWMTVAKAIAQTDQHVTGAIDLLNLPVRRQHQLMEQAYEVLVQDGVEELAFEFANARHSSHTSLGARFAVFPLRAIFKELLGQDSLNRVLVKLAVSPRSSSTQADGAVCDLSTSELAFVLNVSERVTAELGALIGRRVEEEEHDKRGWVFPASVVGTLLTKLHTPKSAEVTIQTFSAQDIWAPGSQLEVGGIASVLSKVLGGDLDVVAVDPAIGVPSLRFQKTARVDASVPPDSNIRTHLTVADCAAKLNIYTDAVYRTLEAGILRSTKVGRRYFITQADFVDFTSRYVFVREVALALKVNPTNLAEKLMDAGVRPVSGPAIDGGLVYLFLRADLAGIDVVKAARAVGYATLTGRKSKAAARKSSKYLRTSEVAELLAISRQQVGVLVRRGAIKEATGVDELTNTRFFHRSDIERYMAKFRHDSDLLTLDSAVAWLRASLPDFFEEDLLYFRRRWVDTGIVSTESDGINVFIKVSDLEMIRQVRMTEVSPNEAATMLRITRATLQNWVKLGRLVPVKGPGIDGSAWNSFSRLAVETLGLKLQLDKA